MNFDLRVIMATEKTLNYPLPFSLTIPKSESLMQLKEDEILQMLCLEEKFPKISEYHPPQSIIHMPKTFDFDLCKTPISEIQRKICLEEEEKRKEKAMKDLLELQLSTTVSQGEDVRDKKKKRKRKQSIASRMSQKKPKDSISDKETAPQSETDSIISSRVDFDTLCGKKYKYSTWTTITSSNPEQPDTVVEIIHIVPMTLGPYVQKKLKCEVGVDIFMDQPWGIITKSKLMSLQKTMKEESPFVNYAELIKAYPEEEILIGRASLYNPDEFVIALTIHGRTVLLEEIKSIHLKYVEQVMKNRDHPKRPWESLGSEKEIEEENVHSSRPLISYDCTLKRETHQDRYKKGFDHEDFYVEITGPIYSAIKNVEGKIFDKATQVGQYVCDVSVETTPEIPVNSTTQFTTEMRVQENEEILQDMELDQDLLKQKMSSFLYKVDTLLTYNEEYDLYQDDYEILANAGEKLNMYPNVTYEHFLTMLSFVGSKGRCITTTSWHPNNPGVIAVSYSKNSIKNIGDLRDNSDEEDYSESDTDDENLFNSVPTSTPFETVIKKLWTNQLLELKEKLKEKRNCNLFKLAAGSLKFMKHARDMRLFEMIQAKKKFINNPDSPDMLHEEPFQYPLFDGTKNKKKKLNMDEILQRPPTFLKRDYLFSDTFQWKLQAAKIVDPMYMMIKHNKEVPKRYIKTLLFREIWSGDEWNFGPELEMMAIDINQIFRDSGMMVLGKPLPPKQTVFLPGFSDDENANVNGAVNPWKEIREFENKNELHKEMVAKLKSSDGQCYKPRSTLEEFNYSIPDYKKSANNNVESIGTSSEIGKNNFQVSRDTIFPILPQCKLELLELEYYPDVISKEKTISLDHHAKADKIPKVNNLNTQNHCNNNNNIKCSSENTNACESCQGDNCKKARSTGIVFDIPHITSCTEETPKWGFPPDVKEGLKEQVKQIEAGEKKTLFKRDIEVLSDGSDSDDGYEQFKDEDELDKLELQHYVVIWSIINDLTPMNRLVSPFEVTSISFCPYTGKYIAGGLITGQVVIWELGCCTPSEPVRKFPDKTQKEGNRHLRRVMAWFKRLNTIERIPVSGLSCKKSSHSDRVIDITWLPPNIQVLPENGGRYNITKSEGVGTLQFLSTSADGTVKYWSLKSIPNSPLKVPFSIHSLQRKSTFKRPKALEKKALKFGELYLRWDPIFQVKFLIPDPAYSASRYHITCVSHDEIPYSYQREVHRNKPSVRRPAMGGEYNMSCLYNSNLLSQAIIGCIDGTLAFVSWQQPTEGKPGEHKLVDQDGYLPATVVRAYNNIHDGPISCISRHPSKENLFLTAGGHVFGLWTIDMEEPLKWKKYTQLFATHASWTGFKGSTFRVGFSDGTIEVWDLLEDGNEAKMRLMVGEASICDLTVPRLPIPRGLIAVADQRGVLKFFNVPMDYQVDDIEEKDRFFNMITSENNRKTIMKGLANDYWKEKERERKAKAKAAAKADAESNKSDLEIDQKQETEKIKFREIVGCKKFKDEMYKWYLRRRGKTSNWLDPAEKLWYSKEEAHMIKTILENKQISMKTLEETIKPLNEKRKRESELEMKMADIVNMSDEVFQSAIQDLEIPRQQDHKSQVPVDIGLRENDDIEKALEKVNLYFGEHYEEKENELEELVKSYNLKKEWSISELLQQNQEVRDFWNDRRRYLVGDQRRIHETVKKEIEKEGLQFSQWINHEESYLVKKYQRRLDKIDELRKIYGSDYDPYWDLESKGERPKRNHFANYMNKVKEDKAMKGKLQVVKASPEAKIDIDLPEGSFYRKYMDDDSEWIKPKTAEEIFHAPAFKFEYGESYPLPSDEEIAEPPKEVKEKDEEVFPWTAPPENKDTVPNLESQSEKKKPLEKPEEEMTDAKESKEIDVQEHGLKTQKVEPFKISGDVEKPKEGVTKPVKEDLTEEEEKFSAIRFKEKSSGEGHGPQKGMETDIYQNKLSYARLKHLQKKIALKKAKGEEIPDIEDVTGYESCSDSSISSLSDSPPTSSYSEDGEQESGEDNLTFAYETEESFKEYFEGAPPRYEPPKRRPYFRAPHEEEPTEEWISEEKK